MIKLEIKKEDGSLYWKEHFNNQSDCDKWLDEEKTRPYWDSGFTYTSKEIDKPDPVKEQENQAKQDLKEQKRQSIITELKSLDWSSVKTIADLKSVFRLLVEDFLKDEA